ncbi:hypothetical protein CMV30_03885 [Nibricoccus aquaticus]|uniref:Uncharacterized protein n=1 Tax=Nibricoccus aquaticus TaxID=2576891 RepID=A0A290QAA0_9BACT|nr:hypothetical protein [Nibricoccus aquaticus]ATC63166.1 hypothetical protein CMV30_03885 [Nibricoccus aquaticus]
MFYEAATSNSNGFSFEASLASSTPESETRHLVNRLRFEFPTATQRQLENAVADACEGATTYAGDKVYQRARANLRALLAPAFDNAEEEMETAPPFRAKVA